MEKSQEPAKPNALPDPLSETADNAVCNTCGHEYDQPIFTVVSSNQLSEEYYACPRCLSKVESKEHQKLAETNETEESEPIQETVNALKQEDVEEMSKCPHEFGYLKKREKTSPIPEECFTCKKMIECRI